MPSACFLNFSKFFLRQEHKESFQAEDRNASAALSLSLWTSLDVNDASFLTAVLG